MELAFGLVASAQQVGGPPAPGALRELAERAEALGYDSLWVTDHLAFRHPILEGVVALSLLAAWTRRISLGTGVLLLPLRPPGLVAKQIASLDHAAGGRVILGIGVGGEGAEDFAVVGVPRGERGRRTDEGIEVMRALWSQCPADFAGSRLRFSGVRMEPQPVQPGGPPIWIGGRSEAALRRVARRGDGWLPYFVSPERYARDWQRIERFAAEAGRDPSALVPALSLFLHLDRDDARAREAMAAHLSERYGQRFSPERVDTVAAAGSAARCIDRIDSYRRTAGVRHVVLLLAVPTGDLREVAEQVFAEVVRPLRGAP